MTKKATKIKMVINKSDKEEQGVGERLLIHNYNELKNKLLKESW